MSTARLLSLTSRAARRQSSAVRRGLSTTKILCARLTARAEAWLAAAALAAAALAAGCAPDVQSIAVRTPGAIAAAPDAVTLVIVQPTTRLRSVGIVDGRGQLVGQLDDRSHTVVRLPEGPTVLYAVVENRAETADRLEGTLVPGRVYYATIDERPGGVAFLALSPRSPDGRWSHKDESLARTPRVQMDPRRVTRAANELGDTDAIVRAGDAHVAGLDAAHAAEHEFQESDGL
jgi:hypothetical protein